MEKSKKNRICLKTISNSYKLYLNTIEFTDNIGCDSAFQTVDLQMLFKEAPIEPVTNGTILYGPGKGLKKMTFQGLDVTKKMVTKIATIDRLKKKIILIQPSETSLYKSGLKERGVSGYLYIFAHAAPDKIQGITEGAIVAKLIRDSGIWNGEPVLVDACNAGGMPNGIASSLALSLQTYVTAPTSVTWNYPLGGSAVGQGAFEKLPGKLANLPFPDLTKPGQWRTWGPDGIPISTTRSSPRDRGNPVANPGRLQK